jgi:1,4-alpha-glucan branching enzyme
MSVLKKYLKTKPICKAKFIAPKPLTEKAKKVYLAAEFNEWKFEATELRKQKNGDFAATIDLAPGEYEYRFVVDGELWENDFTADKYVPNRVCNQDNSVVVI